MSENDFITLKDFTERVLKWQDYEKIAKAIYDSDLDFWWSNCPVPGCKNKTCLALNSDKCFVHTPGWSWWKHLKIWWPHFKYRVTGAWKVFRGNADWVEN